MAGELVSFGIKKLWDLLSQESERFQGVEDQVTGLKRDLNLLGSFLKDADAKKHTTAVVRNCVEEIQEIVFDAEDIIETYLLKESLGKTSGIKKSIKRLAFIIPDRRRYALDIGGIRMRISDVIRDMQSFGVQQAIADGGYMQPHGDRQREMRQTFSKDYESDFVGLDANVKKLVGYLVEEENVQVVSITGMGGLGKTTLARQVFNHEDVKHQFERLAWVCVSQEFTRRSVWQTILQNLTSKERKDEILNMNEAELQDELFRLLETSKSLIVFDDIWKEEDWDLIKRIFPPNKDWKVLLTSRNESVAQGDIAYINFKPECLNIQDSWTLFQRIAMPRKDAPEFKVTDEMEEMAKEMIKHCGGLPLAVKVLGGLLAAKYTLHDWKRLSENIGSHVVIGRTSGNNGSIDHVLSLSFEELPSYLKHCFLYLAIFEEDHMINVSKLSYYWAAEGISEARRYDGETIRDVGDSNVEELVRRNMVISKRDDVTLRFETCHLHDMMREICLLKAKEENFLQIVGASSSSTAYSNSGTSRRLTLHNPTTTSHFDRHIKNLKLRSLVIFWNEFRKEWKLSWLTLTRLQLIRVLDLSRVEFEGKKVPCSLGKLIHLRYLSLEKVVVSHLPYSLRNLKLLIYLNLGVYGSSLLYVPNFLKELRELKYLKLPMFMSDKTKLELSNLEKLETLKNFSTGKSSVDDLRGMARLRILSIRLKDETDLETLSASISGLKRLEGLSIIDDIRPERRIKEGMVLDFIHLKKLKLHIKLPRQQHFHSHLTSISLSHCFLEEDPMPILEKLLQLKKVSLVYKSFSGRRMVCSSGGFPQLQILSIVQLMELEEWIVEEGAMPLLHDLVLVFCDKLKEVPDGLRFIYSLEALTMGMKWKERLSEGGDDYYKVQHIPFVDFLGRHQEIQ